MGSRIDLQTGAVTTRSYLSLGEGYDINICTPVGIGNVKTINLLTDNIRLDAVLLTMPSLVAPLLGLPPGTRNFSKSSEATY